MAYAKMKVLEDCGVYTLITCTAYLLSTDFPGIASYV
jgi:hypothetical protein